MDNIINVLSNPFVWFAFIFILGVIVRKKRKSYLKLLGLLVDAIEVVDNEIKDIIPPAMEAKLIKIKSWINARLDKKEKKEIDTILKNKGYLKRS